MRKLFKLLSLLLLCSVAWGAPNKTVRPTYRKLFTIR